LISDGLKATLADPPNPAKPTNFGVLWFGVKKMAKEHIKLVKPAIVLQANLHPRSQPPLVQVRRKI
jgi:hypothetical protein